MKLTSKDRKAKAAYLAAQPDQFGTLHQRMKAVMELASRAGVSSVSGDLWQALHDLVTEVSYTQPASPPFGRRTL